jgi:hypothetical protein
MISVLLGSDQSGLAADNDQTLFQRRRKSSKLVGRTPEILLEQEDLFSVNSQPIKIDQKFSFDLNNATQFVNIFLWTTQYTNKMTKVKKLLLGYISLPINEINVDCWSTSKGESQSTCCYFNPIEEVTKASVISKLTKSHVLADHPGFDANISMGSLTVNFVHKLDKSIEETDLVGQISDQMVEQNLVEVELNKQINEGTLVTNGHDLVDDGSIHKFLNVQFNETVVCEFCSKKIWFKNAYRCAYCGYIIHLKCYEKTIGKTICGRFFNQPKDVGSSSSLHDENFVIISDDQVNSNKPATACLETMPTKDTTVQLDNSNSRKFVSNVSSLLSGIRHRHSNIANKTSEATAAVAAAAAAPATSFSLSSLKANSFLNSLNVGLINRRKQQRQQQQPQIPNATLLQTQSGDENDDDLSSLDMDDFKDVDTSVEKLFGTELFEELPLEERKCKFEETIHKYQSTIDMMSKIKQELDRELALATNNNIDNKIKSGAKTQQENQIRSQIKHLDDQIKCVAFLLMQCQIGLENCSDNYVSESLPLPTIPIILIDQSNDQNQPRSPDSSA